MKKKIVIIVLITIFLLLSLSLISFYTPVGPKKGSPIETTYFMDEEGNFVANIPKENYLGETIPELNEIVYDITTFGASTNNDFLANREAIQHAIDAAHAIGGGVVLVSGGSYKTTSLELKSNITLRINADSELLCITRQENESLKKEDKLSSYGFLYANNAEKIIIEGPGRIAGNGATYVKAQKDSSIFLPLDTFNLKTYIVEHRKRIMMGYEHEFKRPFIIGMINCKKVTIRNVEIYEAASWTCRLEGLEDLLVDSIIINNNVNVANADGIDIEGGKNIIIRNSFIATADDAICLKTDYGSPPIEGVLVENCEIMSLANHFKIGTATWHDVTDVTVRDCFFFMAGIAGGYSGIAIEAVDGGKISNINIDNIVMEHVTAPLLIWLGYRNGESVLENINISNITATGCDISSAITGYKRGSNIAYVKDVKLSNFNITYREAKEKLNIYNNSAGAYQGILNMKGYPEITRVSHMYLFNHTLSGYWDLPVYGLFARYVDGLEVENFTVTPRSSNTREMNNVQDEKKRIDLKNVIWN